MATGGGGALKYESDVQVPTGEQKWGAFGVRFRRKKGVIRCGHQKNGGFSDVDSQKWGSFSVQKCNFEAKFAIFM